MKERLRAMTVIGMFRAELRKNGLRKAFDSGRKTETVADRLLPTTQSIPFQKLLSLPLPFSPDTASQMLDCHVSQMATASFFEDGEWLGSYFEYDPKKKEISVLRMKFSATTDVENPDLLELKAIGRNGMGEVSMDGVFRRSRCQYRATMVHIGLQQHRQQSMWGFSLLPCGLAGLRVHSQGSWLWMYKADWVGS